MAFSWDEKKREENFELRMVDFAEAIGIFDDPEVIESIDDRAAYAEERIQALGNGGTDRYVPASALVPKLAEQVGCILGPGQIFATTAEMLSPRLKDRPLTGEWRGYRNLHIEPGWLLLYKIDGGDLILARTGTHADLFR